MPRIALRLLFLASLAFPAAAQPRVMLEELTTQEVRAAIAGGATTLLVPIGGTEQNGAHMALGKHNARARVLAERIAVKLGQALVAPVIAYVPDEGHMKFAGTISISDEAFEKTLESAARGLARHGFRDIVFLGDHGGYQKNLARVAARLNKEWAKGPSRAHHIAEYYREMEHAGRDDTALAMDTAPAMVRDPRGATAEAGARRAQEIVTATVEAIRRAARRDR